jgi:uncharacterized phage-associated protein
VLVSLQEIPGRATLHRVIPRTDAGIHHGQRSRRRDVYSEKQRPDDGRQAAQAWSLAWTGQPLFDAEFEAWKKGPVCRTLFAAHRGYRTVKTHRAPEYRESLSDEACAILYSVLAKYGHLEGDDLVELSHRESPWISARGALGPDDNCDEVIPREQIAQYFVTLAKERPADSPERPGEDDLRRARFRRSKENVLRTHGELFEQLAK